MPNMKKEDLHQIMETQCQHLAITQCTEFLIVLLIFEELFDGTLGAWKTDPLYFKSKTWSSPRRPLFLPAISFE